MAKPKKLTNREEAFCLQYIIDLNASRAARDAGYAKGSSAYMGWKILQRPHVQVRVQQLFMERAHRVGVEADAVLAELVKVAFAKITDVAEFGESGVRFLESSDLTPEVAAAISEVGHSETKYGTNLRVKLHDKQRALELLGKHLGLFVERQEVAFANKGRLKLVWEDAGADD